MIGQFRTVKIPPEFITDENVKKLYSRLPYIDDNDLPNLFNMVKMLIDYIVKKELFMLPDNKLIRIKQYIDKHLAEKISLKQLSRYLCCSESSLTHYLHDSCNTTFKKLLTEARLARAGQLMKQNPSISMKELSGRIGFEDSHYFSRVYHKYYAKSPSHNKKA